MGEMGEGRERRTGHQHQEQNHRKNYSRVPHLNQLPNTCPVVTCRRDGAMEWSHQVGIRDETPTGSLAILNRLGVTEGEFRVDEMEDVSPDVLQHQTLCLLGLVVGHCPDQFQMFTGC